MSSGQDDILSRLSAYFPDKNQILNLVDEYTLYCYYLNDEVYINQVILSPLRDPAKDSPDTKPSFVLYEGRDNKLRYYDYGIGNKGGDIFDLVQTLYGLKTLQEVCNKISADFGLGYAGLVNSNNNTTKKDFLAPAERKAKPKLIIKDVVALKSFTITGKNYWDEYHITPEILEEYNVKQISSIITDRSIFTLKSLAFSYRIGDKFKIYQPFEEDNRFVNNYPSNYVEGLMQLHTKNYPGEVLIITKSTKDVMVLRLLGYASIAPKAENILITPEILTMLKTKYNKILILFDDDKAGHRGADKYEFNKIWIPAETNCKDISDFIKANGPQAAFDLMLDLTN